MTTEMILQPIFQWKPIATGPPRRVTQKTLEPLLQPWSREWGWDVHFFGQPEIGIREKSSTTIVYCIQHVFSDVVFFTSPNMDELNIIEASDHSDQQKMGGIRSTIIWIHSPIFKHGNIPNLLWQESSSLGIPCFEILGSLLIKPDSSWHLSNLPSWAKKTPGAWRYHAGNTRINLEMGGIR